MRNTLLMMILAALAVIVGLAYIFAVDNLLE